MSNLQQFEKQSYLSLETFRKNGQGVKTPVWFVQEGENLLIWTEATSGKAKRVRNNGQVKVAPSRGDGTVTGEWIPAAASRDDSPAARDRLRALMVKKYGLAFHLFALLGRLGKRTYTMLKLEIR
jgi:PPOX class probable F420-dependent enzyme